MYHVKVIDNAPIGGLDLNIADDEEFSPDKLRSNLERLYMTFVVGMAGLGNHVARLRSWRESRRTAGFLAVYTVAWILNYVVPLLLGTVIVLIAYPPARRFLFPPAPLALIDSKTGGIQKPKAGVLGSDDSMTGAPEKYKGEAVEQEASNFVSGVASIALSSATGVQSQNEIQEEEGGIDTTTPDPTQLASASADAKRVAQGGTPHPSHDKTKKPMEEAMWAQMRPIMHGIADFADR